MRTEVIKSLNTDNTITVTRDNTKELISIEFNFYITSEVASIFKLPEWARCQDESFTIDSQAKLIPGIAEKRDRVVQTGLVFRLLDFNTLHVSSPTSSTYKGRIEYESTPVIDRGLIINGVRVHCLTPSTLEEFSTLVSIVRNHEGGLIASKTLDSSYKKTFNFTTIPLCNEEYNITENTYAHTLTEFVKILKGNYIGSWVNISLHGENYTTIIKSNISYKDIKAVINGNLKLCKILTFTLEEV